MYAKRYDKEELNRLVDDTYAQGPPNDYYVYSKRNFPRMPFGK